jgi:hypothetical protein
VPIPPQRLAHRRAAADRGELGAGGRRLHGVGGAEIAVTLGEPVDAALAPITAMMSSRLMVLANLLKRAPSCVTSGSPGYPRWNLVWSPRWGGDRP